MLATIALSFHTLSELQKHLSVNTGIDEVLRAPFLFAGLSFRLFPLQLYALSALDNDRQSRAGHNLHPIVLWLSLLFPARVAFRVRLYGCVNKIRCVLNCFVLSNLP